MTGRPLGEASGGDRGFWDHLGQDEGMLPVHLPMGVTFDGQGPEDDSEAHHYECWCGDSECPLTLALGHAWRAGRRHPYGGSFVQYIVPAVYAGGKQGGLPVPMVRADELLPLRDDSPST